MGSLPQLIEEDIQRLNSALTEFLAKTEAELALITAEGGFVILQQGKVDHLNIAALGALASNSFIANKEIAKLIEEPNFNSLYQQGEQHSLYIETIDGNNLFVVIFPSTVAAGVVKYYASSAREMIATQLKSAWERAPGAGLDLAMLNMGDSTDLFKRKG